jgi:hypothetical protein
MWEMEHVPGLLFAGCPQNHTLATSVRVPGPLHMPEPTITDVSVIELQHLDLIGKEHELFRKAFELIVEPVRDLWHGQPSD